jgi:hypothetical protein
MVATLHHRQLEIILNIRGKRSKTDPVDNDAKLLDALETARAQDEYFARTGNFVGPLSPQRPPFMLSGKVGQFSTRR